LHIAIFLPSLRGGGAEKVFLKLACGFVGRNHRVDLILAACEGPYLADVPENINIVDLRARRIMASLPGLVRYLREAQPDVLLSAMDHSNIIAIAAKKIARTQVRQIISVRSTISVRDRHSAGLGRLIPVIARRCYGWADNIIAVSHGVAADLHESIGISREKVCVIYNPVDASVLRSLSDEPVDHPWFKDAEIPILLSVGRLTAAKDYSTLIRAFSLVSQARKARLLILGEGEDRSRIEELVRELELEDIVSLPGFNKNPYAFMSKAALFVLSSAWEGLPNALLEAMACGTPVVSTDCPSGPAEILDNGRLGRLVPVGDAEALAKEILSTLDEPLDSEILRRRVADFSFDKIVDEYIRVLSFGD